MSQHVHVHVHALALALALITLTGCGEDRTKDDDPPENDDLAELEADLKIGCDHFEYGPIIDLTTEQSPTIMHAHHRYDLSLAGVTEIAYGVEGAAGPTLMMLSVDVGLEVLDGDGKAVTAVSSVDPSTVCPASKRALLYELAAGDYTLEFEGDGALSLVIHLPTDEHGH